jgi:hypothetical protein
MASRRSRCLQSAVARTESAAESRWIHRHTRSPASRKGFDASSLTNSSALQAKTLPVEIPAIMNQPPGNLNDQIGQLTYRPERMAIHWLDELGAAHVLSASQGRVLGLSATMVQSNSPTSSRASPARHACGSGRAWDRRPSRTHSRGRLPRPNRRWKSPSSTPNRSSGTGRWRRCPTCWSTSTAARPRASGASRNLGDRRQVDRLGPDHRRGPAGAQRLLSRCFP